MPVYEEKEKVNGQKRWFIRTYIENELGVKKQVTRHNKNWIGRDGYWRAQQEEARIKKKVISDKYNATLDVLVDDFLSYKKNCVEKTTYELYKKEIENYIYPYFSQNKKITSFKLHEAVSWKNYLDEKNLSFAFKKSIYVLMIQIFDYVYKLTGVENVFKQLGNYKRTKKDAKKEMNFLTSEEFNNFIQFEKSDIHRIFFKVLFYTGMRKGEALALTWDDIDFEKNIIDINKTYDTNSKEESLPKTLRSIRKLLMPDVVANDLKYLCLNAKDKYIFKPYIKATTIREHCGRNLVKAGIDKHIRIHDFRHSFASYCIYNNVPIHIISEYLGHQNIYTTLNTYAHLYPNTQQALIDVINKQYHCTNNDINIKQDQKQDQKIQEPLFSMA